MTRQRQRTGKAGEEAAAAYLRQKGYVIERRNYRCRLGELDIVARDGPLLVFVEVRTRSTSRFGLPAESVTAAKQARLRKLALHYLQTVYGREMPCRFDLVAVEMPPGGSKPRLTHLMDVLV